jgi:hypothetical protein
MFPPSVQGIEIFNKATQSAASLTKKKSQSELATEVRREQMRQ